ncbi:MAG: hypothetical protein H7Y38_20790, partial [Armatimonadetes bacterium]|nr:hypothetical protein [Armatimonadota bacterium]
PVSDASAPRPRRTRKPVAELTPVNAETDAPADSAPEIVAAELSPIAPRPRRSRRTPAAPAEPTTFDDVPMATSGADDAAENIEQVFDLPPTDTDAPADDAAMEEIRAESEAILEEVLAETPPESSRSRNRNRRGRGRGSSGTDAAIVGVPAEPVPANGVFRKRGAGTLVRTMPLPALPVTGDVTAPAPEIAPVLRKRGVRNTLTTRRVLTPDGVSVVAAAQVAALLGSVSMVPILRVEGDITVPVLVPLVEPVVPEYAPLAAEILEKLPQVSVVRVNGLPELHVNDAPITPAFLFVNTEVTDEPEVAQEIAVREIRRAYTAGVRLFTLMAHLPWRRKSGDRRYDSINAVLGMVAENAPDALVLPRLIFSPPVSWERAHEDDMAAYDSGEPGDVSIGSDLFWQEEAKDALRAAVEHLAQSEHAPRTLGVFLEHGEWFHPKGVGADRSPANTAAFRVFLKEYYASSEVALRSAWHDGSVTFDAAEIPSPQTLMGVSANGSQPVFLGEREQRIADFYRYTSEITAQRITHLAQIVKEASAGRMAVAASYGYTLEIARPNCGHYALSHVLASPDVDIITAPLSYTGRMPGGSAPLPLPVDSVHLAGKLFVGEDDTKTHLALRETGDDYNPKLATEADTRAVHARNVGTLVAKGCGVSWMDLWGEGWLDNDAVWENLGGLMRVMESAAALRRTRLHPVPAPEVAVFVDEEAFFDVAASSDAPILAQLVGHHRDIFARAGASVGYYLFSDLAKESFPDAAKLFVFLTPFCLPLSVHTAMKTRWQNVGRTFVWLFAPGVGETGNIAEFSETLGFQLRLQPWGSRTGTVVTDGKFILTENAKGERFGEETRINPSLTVADPKAQILGEYVASGNPSLAYRKHPRWQSVFVGERELPLPLVRGLYRLANVNVTMPGDDATAIAGDGFVSVHSPRDAGVTAFSPTRAEASVYDAATGELLAGTGYGAEIETAKGQTRLLFFAAPEELEARFGIAAEALTDAPQGLLESDLPALGKPFEMEAAPVVEARRQPVAPPATATRQSAPPAPAPKPQQTRLYPVELSVSEEDIAQFEAALAGEIALLDKDADEAESEAGRKKRRRRRRRGGNNGEVVGENGETEGADADEGDTGEGDVEPGDDVFGFGAVAQASASFDADALLPLLPQGDSEAADALGGGRLPSSHELPVDLLADVMERLFSLPELAPVKPAGVPEPARRPTLDELLPFSETPDAGDVGETRTSDTLFAASDAEAETTSAETIELEEMVEVLSPTEQAAEPAPEPTAGEPITEPPAEPVAEPMGLLSEGAVRTRRGSGGFASRLRQRAADRAPRDPAAENDALADAPLGEADETAS